jgi:ribosome-associated protein
MKILSADAPALWLRVAQPVWYTGSRGGTSRPVTEAEKQPSPERTIRPEGQELALLCARLLDERRMRDLAIFDVENVLQIATYFIVATGTSPRHLKRTADFVLEKLKERGLRPAGVEGYDRARWVLFDLGDVVVHLLVEEARRFYNLELLWGDCPRLPLPPGV